MRLEPQDPEVFLAIHAERRRQEEGLELIASENYTSPAVLEATGSVLTNKYAEGLPGARYYGGCEHVDTIERLARERAKALFGAEAANVQPHSGAQANAAVFLALLKPGDRILGQNLSHGGHLTHGSPVNSSGILYQAAHYGVDEATGRIDMDRVREAALAHRPQLIICGASAYPRTLDFAAFRAIADEVGALLLADISHVAGLVVGDQHPSPMRHCHVVTTTTHKTLRGPRGGLILCGKDDAKRINKGVFPGTQGGPLMHVIAGKAVAFGEALQPSFRDYAKAIVDNAKAMAERLLERGMTLVSGGTDNHLMLLDLGDLCSGKEAEEALDRAGITVNKNTVPGERRSPMITSGVRIGTPAITTRGVTPGECRQIADWIVDVLHHRDDADRLAQIRAEIRALCLTRPVYPALAG
ncbi:MAG TPA: serine hydroxymethyltransferase [Myxococcota bacterium]|nr:serine hydroxymethyltransferase [Myxococcota bacterium]